MAGILRASDMQPYAHEPSARRYASAPTRSATPRMSQVGMTLLAAAGAIGLLVTLVRNDVLYEWARRSAREADYLAVERLILGGPPSGTIRAVQRIAGPDEKAITTKPATTAPLRPTTREAVSKKAEAPPPELPVVEPEPAAVAAPTRAPPSAEQRIEPDPSSLTASRVVAQEPAEVAIQPMPDLTSPYAARLDPDGAETKPAPPRTSLLDAIRGSVD